MCCDCTRAVKANSLAVLCVFLNQPVFFQRIESREKPQVFTCFVLLLLFSQCWLMFGLQERRLLNKTEHLWHSNHQASSTTLASGGAWGLQNFQTFLCSVIPKTTQQSLLNNCIDFGLHCALWCDDCHSISDRNLWCMCHTAPQNALSAQQDQLNGGVSKAWFKSQWKSVFQKSQLCNLNANMMKKTDLLMDSSPMQCTQRASLSSVITRHSTITVICCGHLCAGVVHCSLIPVHFWHAQPESLVCCETDLSRCLLIVLPRNLKPLCWIVPEAQQKLSGTCFGCHGSLQHKRTQSRPCSREFWVRCSKKRGRKRRFEQMACAH